MKVGQNEAKREGRRNKRNGEEAMGRVTSTRAMFGFRRVVQSMPEKKG